MVDVAYGKSRQEKTKITRHWRKCSRENKEKVDDIMTLAMFPIFPAILTAGSLVGEIHQDSVQARKMSPGDITNLTQSITEKDRQALLRLGSERIGKMDLCC